MVLFKQKYRGSLVGRVLLENMAQGIRYFITCGVDSLDKILPTVTYCKVEFNETSAVILVLKVSLLIVKYKYEICS